MRDVLISGGGIAGTALAYWLRHHGFAPTVVERAPAPRRGGQAIDVRGAALDVVDRMGLLEAVREHRTHMRGMSVLAPDGTEVHRSTEYARSSGRLDGDDVELMRDDLVRLLHGSTRDGVEYVYGDAIEALEDTADGVRVAFRNGPDRVFDLVVGADGLHSGVRRLAFGPEERFSHHMGIYLSVFTAENFLGLEDWQVWLKESDRGFAAMTVRGNAELRVALGFDSAPLDGDHRDTEWLRDLIVERAEGMAWSESRKLAAYARDAEDFFCDAMAQVRMDRWSRGRVVLLGDAGYCPSPVSGQGTSLALVGAYVLAGELARAGGDHAAGFAAYEERMRPFVELNQALATENPDGPAPEESVDRAKNAIALDAA
ncbi:FAD-dependent monooxygenase [Streptomyces sp. TRM49041]|uniref:FAD-dependent monooxygenase n=1 Tax=Streptomyces sp. TRM49041 TaxID=2603216 RepID=UPI0011ED5913|nr:FAD-dependent monooxygenase [Streptomyces sp. TRM49041]